MSHQTFAIITVQGKTEDEFLFRVKDSKISQFYSWENRAIGGSHRQEDFRKQFCSDFGITEDEFERFQKENIPLNKTDRRGEKSISLLKLTVSEAFYSKTKHETENFKWVVKSTVENLLEEEGLATEEKWVLRYLFHDPLDFTKLPPALFETLKTIKEAHEKRKLVIFAGAGVSFDSGAPLWKETSDAILPAIGLEPTNADATLIGQWLHNEKDEKEYNEKLRQTLGYYRNLQPNPIHRQILRLRPRHVVTTNYDDLFEKAMKEHQQAFFGSSYTVIKKDKELPYAVNEEYIIKMHGDWEEMNFVFKEDDYLDYSQNFPLIESFVKGLFSSHLVLFVGFSFSDSNLKQIINWVKRILGKDFQRAFLFQHVDEIAPHQEKYFRRKSILPIAYNSSITKLLAEIELQKEVVIPSEPGRRTYNFLRLLELFNYRDYERLKKAHTQHVLDQMYESLKQFDAFNSIPPATLEKLFPFSPTRLHLARVKDYHRESTDARHETGSHLQTSNERIIALMKSIEFLAGRILLKENSPEAEAIRRVPHFEEKLAYVFDKLRSSQINCIQRIDDNSKDNHNRINFVTNFSKELPFVQWLDFQYKPLLKAVHSRRLMPTGSSVRPLRERLLDGLVLSRLHCYLEAYEVYSGIEKEALKNQDFATFFICQHNKLFVGRMVVRSADFGNYSQDLVERVEDEINAIDLAAYLRVMQLERDVKDLLNGILQKDFFDKYSSKIRKSYKKVLKTYEFFQNPNSRSSGSNDAYDLIEWFAIIYWFYFSNGILLGWDSHKLVELTEMVFEAQVASICTSDRDPGRMEKMNIEFLRVACHFLETKKLGEILERYKFEEFIFASVEEKKQLIQLAFNWFSSLFDESHLFFSINKNRDIVRYFQDKEYSGEVDYLSNNFLLIFSHIDLEELRDSSELPQMIDAILKALLHFLGEKSLWDEKYLIKFLYKNLKFFSQKQIEMVLVATAKSRGWTHRIGIYLARFLEENKIDFQLADGQVLRELIYPNREGCGNQNKVDDYVFLHPYLSSDLQKELVAAVREKLSVANAESVLFWFQAKCEGALPSEEELPDNLLKVFAKQFAGISAIQFQPDGEVILRHSTYDVNIPYWFGALVYSDNRSLGIETTKHLIANSNLPDAFRWLLDPKGFDYKTFNCYWVFFFDGAEVLSKIGAMKIPALRKAFEKELKKEFSSKLAELYHKYFA